MTDRQTDRQTGYPSIDKPWRKYYDASKKFLPSADNFVKVTEQRNAHNLDTFALEYYQSKITYQEFLYKYKNDLVKALVANGVMEADAVAAILPGIPEAMYLLYACGHINATAIFMPPYLDDESMVKDLNKRNVKYLFILDKFLENTAVREKMDRVIPQTHVSNIVVVPYFNSAFKSQFVKKQLSKTKISMSNAIGYKDFIDTGKEIELPGIASYNHDCAATVVYSSGSTGLLKGIELLHDSLVLAPQSYGEMGIDMTCGQKIYQSIPLWSSTGLVALGTSALYCGCCVYQNPQLDPVKFIKNIGKRRVNWAVGTRDLFNTGILKTQNDSRFKLLTKLGYYRYGQLSEILIGGTPVSKNNLLKLTSDFKKLGASVSVGNSYGTCENAAVITIDGVPLPGINIMILDNNNRELPMGKKGKIAVTSPFLMKGYLTKEIPEDELYFYSSDGTKYLITGDIGFVTDEGKLEISGRAKDKIIIKGKTVYLFDLVNTINNENPNVFDCEVLYLDKSGSYELYIQIVLMDDSLTDIDTFRKIQRDIFGLYGNLDIVPKYFKIRDSFPMAASTKRDLTPLKDDKDYVFVDPTEQQY